MKAKLILKDNKYHLLCSDGSIIFDASLKHLNTFVFNFKNITVLNGLSDHSWSKDGIDMVDFSLPNSQTVAYITDNDQLVFNTPAPLLKIFYSKENPFFATYVTVKEYAALHNKSITTVKKYCQNNKVVCNKRGHDWMIKADCPLPVDKRKK